MAPRVAQVYQGSNLRVLGGISAPQIGAGAAFGAGLRERQQQRAGELDMDGGRLGMDATRLNMDATRQQMRLREEANRRANAAAARAAASAAANRARVAEWNALRAGLLPPIGPSGAPNLAASANALPPPAAARRSGAGLQLDMGRPVDTLSGGGGSDIMPVVVDPTQGGTGTDLMLGGTYDGMPFTFAQATLPDPVNYPGAQFVDPGLQLPRLPGFTPETPAHPNWFGGAKASAQTAPPTAGGEVAPLTGRELEAQQFGQGVRGAVGNVLDRGAGYAAAAGMGILGGVGDLAGTAAAVFGLNRPAAAAERWSDINYNAARLLASRGYSSGAGVTGADLDMEPRDFNPSAFSNARATDSVNPTLDDVMTAPLSATREVRYEDGRTEQKNARFDFPIGSGLRGADITDPMRWLLTTPANSPRLLRPPREIYDNPVAMDQALQQGYSTREQYYSVYQQAVEREFYAEAAALATEINALDAQIKLLEGQQAVSNFENGDPRMLEALFSERGPGLGGRQIFLTQNPQTETYTFMDGATGEPVRNSRLRDMTPEDLVSAARSIYDQAYVDRISELQNMISEKYALTEAEAAAKAEVEARYGKVEVDVTGYTYTDPQTGTDVKGALLFTTKDGQAIVAIPRFDAEGNAAGYEYKVISG